MLDCILLCSWIASTRLIVDTEKTDKVSRQTIRRLFNLERSTQWDAKMGFLYLRFLGHIDYSLRYSKKLKRPLAPNNDSTPGTVGFCRLEMLKTIAKTVCRFSPPILNFKNPMTVNNLDSRNS